MADKKKQRRDYRSPVDDRRLPGVTTVMKNLGWNTDALLGWANKLGREGKTMAARDNAAARGSLAHALAESMLGFGDFDEHVASAEDMSEADRIAREYVRALREIGDVVAVELALVLDANGLGFGGTLDAVVRAPNGMLVVCDLKTGRDAYPETRIQLGAYAMLHAQNGRGVIEAGAVINIPWGQGSSARVYEITSDELVRGASVFMSLLAIDSHREVLQRRFV